jgi:PAS domain S-box-containing protein
MSEHPTDLLRPPPADESVRFQAALLDAIGQAVIATDPLGVIVYWNHAAELLYGWSAAEAIGLQVIDVTP